MTERTQDIHKIQKNLSHRLNSWKKKAVTRNKKICSQAKRIQELIKSRDAYKVKLYSERLVYGAAIKKIKREYKQVHKALLSAQKVKRHHYSLDVISLCLSLRDAGQVSLRTCQALLKILVVFTGLNLKIPSINSIRNWEHKKAFYNLEKNCDNTDDYAIIIDESFFIGHQTLLLLLGVNLSKYQFDKSLGFHDVEILGLHVNKSWTGDQIAAKISAIQKRAYRIVYCCSDGNPNLKKSLRIKDLTRVEDCTHVMSKLIEKEYKTQEHFKDFLSKTSLLNRQNYMGKDAAICPPKLRGKARYLNMYPLVAWGVKNLKLLDSLCQKARNEEQERIYNKLKWLESKRVLLEELALIISLLASIFKLLKTGGLRKKNIEKIKKLLDSTVNVPSFFKQGVEQYLQDNRKLLGKYDQLVCCSDIIESHFGKFKNQQAKNPNKGVSLNCLRLANYGVKMSKKVLQQALESTKMINIANWKVQNNLESLIEKKNKIYKKVG